MNKKSKHKQYREVAVMSFGEYKLLRKLAKRMNVSKSRAIRMALAREEVLQGIISLDNTTL